MTTDKIEINFASSNADKIAEVKEILGKHGIKVNSMDVKVREIQADSLEQISADSARTTAKFLGKSAVVEDAGLFISCLRGFPGPYSSYVYRTIGCDGILRLMQGQQERTAIFRSAVSYCEPTSDPVVFTGETIGKITVAVRTGRRFGYDPIFVPDESDGRAFSELGISEKSTISHRSKAFAKLAHWLLSMRTP